MARHAHRPDPATRRQVEALAGFGIPEADIAGVVGIDPKTLRKHYPNELRHGHVKANARVAEFLFRRATTEGPQAVTAAIFWLKTRAAWKETMVSEVIHDAADSMKALMARIAIHGPSIHHRAGHDTESGQPTASSPKVALPLPPPGG